MKPALDRAARARGRALPAGRPWWRPWARGFGSFARIYLTLLVYLAGGVVGLFAALVFLALIIPPALVQMAFAVVTGAVRHPIVLLARIHPNPTLLAIGVLALAATIAGFDSMARWWCAATGRAGRWKRRWTLAAVSALALTSAVAISGTAVVHQAGWLVTAPEGFVIRDRYARSPEHRLDALCANLEDETALRSLLAAALAEERWQVEVVRDQSGKPAGIVAHATDMGSPSADRAFTCDGLVDAVGASAYIEAIESSPGAAE